MKPIILLTRTRGRLYNAFMSNKSDSIITKQRNKYYIVLPFIGFIVAIVFTLLIPFLVKIQLYEFKTIEHPELVIFEK